MHPSESVRENQIFLLMITDAKRWGYLVVKILCALFRRITSKHVGDLLLKLFSFILFEIKLEKYYEVSKNYDYSYLKMANKDNMVLKYNIEKSLQKINLQFILI